PARSGPATGLVAGEGAPTQVPGQALGLRFVVERDEVHDHLRIGLDRPESAEPDRVREAHALVAVEVAAQEHADAEAWERDERNDRGDRGDQRDLQGRAAEPRQLAGAVAIDLELDAPTETLALREQVIDDQREDGRGQIDREED